MTTKLKWVKDLEDSHNQGKMTSSVGIASSPADIQTKYLQNTSLYYYYNLPGK
jgi:hypothetical protein